MEVITAAKHNRCAECSAKPRKLVVLGGKFFCVKCILWAFEEIKGTRQTTTEYGKLR